jgi:hypothetical protein
VRLRSKCRYAEGDFLSIRAVSNPWDMAKDGKTFFCGLEQDANKHAEKIIKKYPSKKFKKEKSDYIRSVIGK